MKRIKRGYRDFWAPGLFIHWMSAIAGEADLSRIYRQEADFLIQTLGLSPDSTTLDLGCGTGGHCLALAQHGIHATGIDIAPTLTDHARKSADRAGLSATFICADMRTFRPDARFDAAYTSSGTFGVYESDDDNRSVLRTIRASLADDGRFLIGPSGPDLLNLESFSKKDEFVLEDGRLLRETAWDQSTSLFRESMSFTDKDGTVVEFGGFDDASDAQYSRVYSFEELQQMLSEEGLRFEAAYGSFDLPPVPYGSDTPRLLIAGRKA